VMCLGPQTLLAYKILQFRKSKMAAAAILKNKKSQYLCNGLTNFDEIWHVTCLKD